MGKEKNSSNSKKTVYCGMAIDVLHPGHLNIINEAKKLGRVIVGLLTDEAIAEYKRVPLLDFKQRKLILENIKDVDEIVPQYTYDYSDNLRKLKPDYVVHGDDWKKGVLKTSRKKVIDVLKEWNGKLIEPKFTEGVSSSELINVYKRNGITSDNRLESFKKILSVKPIINALEAHNGLTGVIVEKAEVYLKGKRKVLMLFG